MFPIWDKWKQSTTEKMHTFFKTSQFEQNSNVPSRKGKPKKNYVLNSPFLGFGEEFSIHGVSSQNPWKLCCENNCEENRVSIWIPDVQVTGLRTHVVMLLQIFFLLSPNQILSWFCTRLSPKWDEEVVKVCPWKVSNVSIFEANCNVQSFVLLKSHVAKFPIQVCQKISFFCLFLKFTFSVES